jgi:hypothetical protein
MVRRHGPHPDLIPLWLGVRVASLVLRSSIGRSRFEQRGVFGVFVGGFEQPFTDIVIRNLPCEALGPVGL